MQLHSTLSAYESLTIRILQYHRDHRNQRDKSSPYFHRYHLRHPLSASILFFKIDRSLSAKPLDLFDAPHTAYTQSFFTDKSINGGLIGQQVNSRTLQKHHVCQRHQMQQMNLVKPSTSSETNHRTSPLMFTRTSTSTPPPSQTSNQAELTAELATTNHKLSLIHAEMATNQALVYQAEKDQSKQRIEYYKQGLISYRHR